MLKQIQKIKNLGVFKDYSRPADMKDFATKNIIYGWNYSGKTTISRLFGLLESKKDSDFPNLKFTFSADDGEINERNYKSNTKIVRVFNSDFIWNNISFAGNEINPILLLGEESKEAEEKIECLQQKLDSCQTSIRKTEHKVSAKSRSLGTLKTQESATIKRTIRLVPAFGATQLDSAIRTVRQGGEYTLSEEDLDSALSIAHRADSDVLPPVDKVDVDLRLLEMHRSAEALLLKKPEFTNTIQYLVDNTDVADWIEKGLPLHENKDSCEFCGNKLEQDRLNDLYGHFSKDLVEHKSQLNILLQNIESTRISVALKQESAFNPQFHKNLKEINGQLTPALAAYNKELDKIAQELKEKLSTPFEVRNLHSYDGKYKRELEGFIERLNGIIDENNAISENFTKEKNKEIERLKKHFTKEFIERVSLDEQEQTIKSLEKRKEKLIGFKKPIEDEINRQKAIISLAQKGRKEINKRIESLLGSDSIKIAVVNDGESERFQLVRGDEPASNLSEGEKTAIAFSYFLTKLQELSELDKTVVYIDDPISSLDSNHIFQVASIIKATFFYQESPGTGEWLSRCKQIFLSTHNFEFFSLLRELPMKKSESRFYMIKRLNPKESTLNNLPDSILKYSSEYHYLFNVLYEFHNAPDKTSLEVLLSLPNAIRRFVELYTYTRYPDYKDVRVDRRADRIFGEEASKRILKVLHIFSHSNNIERIATNNNLISDIEIAVTDLMNILEKDEMHYEALKKSVAGH